MKGITLALLLLLFCGFSIAQERISALQTNPAIYKELSQTRASEHNTLDSTFIYEYTSLELKHVHDEFSTNKFEQFEKDFAAPSELFHYLMDETNTTPLASELIFCDGEYAHHDTVKMDEFGIEIETVTHYPFTPFDVFVNDLDFYPVEGELIEELYQECYVIVDSIIDGILDADQDTIWYNTQPGPSYFQDSARVFTKVVNDTNILWVDNYACHNYTFAKNPWSLGVATFDGVDENGRPYEFGVESAHGVADYLTSRSINLSASVDMDDDLYLTFIYQAKGHGNMPESEDSLILEFWNQDIDEWVSQDQWFGIADDVTPSSWDTARIQLSPGFNNDTEFRFRFKNYATLSGALDHWHIDYVKLEVPVILGEPFKDLAVAEPINTFLEDYTRVPWDHYKATSGNEKMLDSVTLKVFNSDNTSTNFSNGEFSIRHNGILQAGSPFVIPSTGVLGEPNYLIGLTNERIGVGTDYFYDQSVLGNSAYFDVKVNIADAGGGVSNVIQENDTTTFTQRFDNYYAYDDGSAEAAYGVDGTGSLMAYKFEAYQAGALTGILMHFVPSVTDLSGEVFLMTVWADDGGFPGEIIYQDDYFESHSPEYSGSKEGFRYYEFKNSEYVFYEDIYKEEGEHPDSSYDEALLNVPEVFYVGWQNIGDLSMNVGLDFNTDNGEKVFRNTTGEWFPSSFDMSLLIRPVFATALNSTLDLDELETEEWDINLYPNPTSDNITLTGLPDSYELRIFDMSGRMVTYVQNEHQVNVQQLEKGMYIVDVRNDSGENIYSTKLIKR